VRVDSVRLLYVEDEPHEGSRLLELLRGPAGVRRLEPRVELYTVPGLSAALARLASGGIDALLLDLSLPNCHPLDALTKVRARAPELPVIVLGAADDEEVITRALHAGAFDYLLRGELTAALLKRTLRAALEQHRLQAMLSKLTLRDELTGLLTRHGFFMHAEHQLKLARRSRGLYLLLVSVDGLRDIAEHHGHGEADRAIADVAALLRQALRESDLLARLSGDEFVILLVDVPREALATVQERLEESLATLNARAGRRYALGLTVGAARCEPLSALTLDQLFARADDALYDRKRGVLQR
jgi:two-component system cell cycle response regulator